MSLFTGHVWSGLWCLVDFDAVEFKDCKLGGLEVSLATYDTLFICLHISFSVRSKKLITSWYSSRWNNNLVEPYLSIASQMYLLGQNIANLLDLLEGWLE